MNIKKTKSEKYLFAEKYYDFRLGKCRSASITLKSKTKASQNEASKLLSIKIENRLSDSEKN